MNAPTIDFRFLLKLFKDAFNEWSKDNAMRLAAALSYYSIFSTAPLLMIATGIVGWIYGADASNGKIAAQLQTMVGPQAAKSLQSLVQSASEHSGGATFIGFAVLLVGASTVFGQLKDALDTIWEVRTKPGLNIMNLLRERLLLFSMVLVIGFLLLISLVAATALTSMGPAIEGALHIPTAVNGLFLFVISLGVETVLFALIFKVLPSAQIDWACVWVGAAFTAVLFEIGKNALSLYLGLSSTTSSFGAAGSAVVLLLWVFYASCIFFYGATVTEVYARATGRSIQPALNAESTELKCAGGEPVSASHADGRPAPSQPHALTPDKSTPSAPERETLLPLLRQAHARPAKYSGPRIPPATFMGRLEESWNRLDEHPFSTVGAALGVGLAAGLISRLLDKPKID